MKHCVNERFAQLSQRSESIKEAKTPDSSDGVYTGRDAQRRRDARQDVEQRIDDELPKSLILPHSGEIED